MRLEEIINIIKEYFFLALIAVIVLGVVFFLIYVIVYKKLLRGKKNLPKKQLLLVGLFITYVLMVIGVTFLNRGQNYQGGIELSLFSSYREAWYNFSLRHWQFIYLNIFMFVPFGMILPILHSRFRKALWTIGTAALFTLSIESVQFITGYGVFEADDLFNNLLGAIIGYGIIMGLITVKEKRIKRSFVYYSPLLLVLILSGSMFTYYHMKEFGNLSIAPIHRIDMTETAITFEQELNDHKMTAPVYKAPSYTKEAADQFVKDFSEKIHLDTSNMEVIYYQNEGVYWIGENRSHNLWLQYLDGGYSYTDFSSFDEGKELVGIDEETLKELVIKFGIDIPQNANFGKIETGTYKWTVDKKVRGNQLIDGSVLASYYDDHTVKRIENQLITYDKVRDVQIKSEHEAYEDILKGKFKYFYENRMIKNLHIDKIELSFYLDSKGYYQPVYAFHSTVDGRAYTIHIPAI